MSYSPTKIGTWSRSTLADGELFDDEFTQIYDDIENNICGNSGSAPPKTMKAMSDLLDATVNVTGNQTIAGIKTFSSQISGTCLGSAPVGGVIAWVPGYFANNANGTYAAVSIILPTEWKECDGSALNDAASPIFNGAGRYLPNITDSRFLMGSTTPGSIGGNNDGHYHEMGTGADLNITASGGHIHNIVAHNSAGGSYTRFASSCFTIDTLNVTNYSDCVATNTHTHAAGNFSGRIGLVTGGFDGNASGSNIPKYLTCRYIMRIK